MEHCLKLNRQKFEKYFKSFKLFIRINEGVEESKSGSAPENEDEDETPQNNLLPVGVPEEPEESPTLYLLEDETLFGLNDE